MARGRKPEKKSSAQCYVYLLKDGAVPLYVGKGSGRRASHSQRKHGGEIEYLERDLTDREAFLRERFWIAEINPENNICPGGNGGVTKVKRLRKTSQQIEIEKEIAAMEAVGSRVYAARFLLRKLSPANCEHFGISKVGLTRLREVAYG